MSPESLRILLVVGQLRIGGAEKQVVLLAKRLRARGYRVAVAAFYPEGELEAELRQAGISTEIIRKRTRIGLEVISGLSRLLRRDSYDIVHSFLYPANWRARVAARLAGTRGVIISTRSYESHLGWHRLLANRLLWRWTGLAVVNAEALKRHLVEDLGMGPEKIRIVPNGLDLAPFRDLPGREEARKRLGIPAEAPVLGSVGNFEPEKNQGDLVRLLARVRRSVPDARLLLVGGGRREIELRKLAASLDLEDSVLFTGPSRRVPECLAAMDLFLNSSRREGCCNAILEAMAASLPVLAYDVGGNPELVEDAVTGFVFRPLDWEGMADQATALLRDPGKRRQLGAAGRARVEERFRVDETVERTEGLYREVLGLRTTEAPPAVPCRGRGAEGVPETEVLWATVIMPVRNEESHLRESLQAVLSQDLGADRFEVLVVDGRSTDATREIASGFAARHPSVRLLDNPGGIVPTAMNVGLEEARGEFVVRVDGHCIIAPDYLRNAVETLRRTGSEGVGGAMAAVGNGFWGRAIALATSSPFGVGNARFHYSLQEGDADTAYLGAYRRDFLRRIGGYDTAFVRNQDDELNYRIRKRGGRIYYTPAMRASYHVRPSLARLFRQYFQYGLWKVPVYRKTSHPVQIRHLIPSLFLLALLASLILGIARPLFFLVGAVILGLHLLVGSAWAVRQGGIQSSTMGIPVVFLVLHLAYGAGFLLGAFRRVHPSSQGAFRE